MRKLRVLTLLSLIIILPTLSISTSSAWAESGSQYILDDPCEGFTPLDETQINCGTYKEAGYRIEVPENWNGDLLMWAHGYRLFYTDHLWVDNPPFREWLIENGYAWAASSYSANGFNISVGVDDTKALVDIFKKEFAKPKHIYIAGDSMGGSIAITSIEQWPNLYNAGMPTCAVLDPYAELDYIWDYYVLSSVLADKDAKYPIPEDYVSSGNYASTVNELALIPGYFPFLLNEHGEQLKSALNHLTGGERPLFNQGFSLWYGFIDYLWGFPLLQVMIDFDVTGVNGVFVDNWDTVYQLDNYPDLSLEEQALNETVFRIERDPQALHPNGLPNLPVNNGKIQVPVLTLHGIGDLFVPISQEQIYAQNVAQQGASELLVQRAIRDIVHCEFTEEEYTTAFMDLVNWVETGQKPDGDDLLDPAVVSDNYFGCQFTSEDRDYTGVNPIFYIPPCQ